MFPFLPACVWDEKKEREREREKAYKSCSPVEVGNITSKKFSKENIKSSFSIGIGRYCLEINLLDTYTSKTNEVGFKIYKKQWLKKTVLTL